MSQDQFINRHLGTDESALTEMLSVIGVSSVDELMTQVIPHSIRIKKIPDLPETGMSEAEFAQHIRQIADKNKIFRSLIGMGYYRTAVPAVIIRNVLENPSWYTSYTPYQAEISQGRMEALLTFQTAMAELTGMEVCNCSLLDEATATAEAMLMMHSLRPHDTQYEKRNILFVDENIFPQTLDLLLTRSEPKGIEIVCDNFETYEFSGREFGVIVQFPAANGALRDYDDFAAAAHSRSVLVTAVVDPLSLALLKEPGAWGADIAVGSTQRFGTPLGFGGPHAAFLATREKFKRNMPGRIIGVSIDRLGNRALRMALQTREQHIKRERATSNICTAQALPAVMVAFYTQYHGAEGLRRIAIHAHSHAVATSEALKKLGFKTTGTLFFDTIEIEADTEKVRALALEQQLNFCYPDQNHIRISFDELSNLEETNDIIAVFAKAIGKKTVTLKKIEETVAYPKNLIRTTPFLTDPVFRKYHSETALMRYIKELERRDLSLTQSMIPLGSCTMKLNSAVTMMTLSLAGFTEIHPFAPVDQRDGYTELIDRLSHDLAAITGFDSVSLQPNSGANGEYSGLMVIRAYYQNKGQGYRNVVLIPASAHGTNPASAVMAGMRVITVACDDSGDIDMEDLKLRAEQYADELCCLMITYPSTHGVFESRIRDMIEIIHDNGGQVYMDGANMNAQVGLTQPGYIGADICHLNLHKTFAMPHGGGGPGVGPICAAKHLAEFLPGHAIVETGGENGITAVAGAPFGNALLLPITYGYICMLGAQGLRKASEIAIVHANYMAAALKDEFSVLYTGDTGRVGHEMILDLRHFRKEYGIECADIARRLMDYGFHAPTLSFPVHETLMIEPTESEPKEAMDRFMEALVQIKRECEAIRDGAIDKEDNPVKMAPHTAEECCSDDWAHPYSRQTAAFPLKWTAENKFFPYVSRIDNGYGDRHFCCVWPNTDTNK